MNDVYSLRIYDTELLRFSMKDTQGLSGVQTKLLSLNEEVRHLLPLNLKLTDDGILSWLRNRVIPKNRAFVTQILQQYGLSINDTKGIIDVCKGLSLNDSYWVVPDDFDGGFAEYNLFENRFDETLALVAYVGFGSSNRQLTTSPELTTNGMLPKAWRFIEGKGIVLYKGGTEGASNLGREPYCEYYASQIAQAMGLNAVRYGLENWKGKLSSTCELFTDINTAFVSAYSAFGVNDLQQCLDRYDELGEEYGEQLRSMLVFDALIYNTDRHFNNLGVLRDNHTGKIIAPAPVFDNGLSLFCYAGVRQIEDLDELRSYAKTCLPPYGISYERICAAVTGPLQKEQLRGMIGFKFERHPSLNFSEKHLHNLETLLQERVRELLAIPTVQ